MTAREKEMLKMSEEDFERFKRTQLMHNDYFVFDVLDYIAWLDKTKFIKVSIATVSNKIEAGIIDVLRKDSFYPENIGKTQSGKVTENPKLPKFIIMNLTTMSYEGYNESGGVGKPTLSAQKKKQIAKRIQE